MLRFRTAIWPWASWTRQAWAKARNRSSRSQWCCSVLEPAWSSGRCSCTAPSFGSIRRLEWNLEYQQTWRISLWLLCFRRKTFFKHEYFKLKLKTSKEDNISNFWRITRLLKAVSFYHTAWYFKHFLRTALVQFTPVWQKIQCVSDHS